MIYPTTQQSCIPATARTAKVTKFLSLEVREELGVVEVLRLLGAAPGRRRADTSPELFRTISKFALLRMTCGYEICDGVCTSQDAQFPLENE